ncbi:MAG: hypothetical protein IMZ43_03125 [Thermoplasmata archaeon]|nr:hypothetical protein [Thermoplasmata archaeon]
MINGGVEKRVTSLSTALVVVILFLGVVPLVVQADGPTLVQVSPASKTVSAGQTFTITVACTPGQSIKSYELKLLFNPTLLQANSVSEGTIFNGYTTFFNDGTINNTAGSIVDIYGLIIGAGTVSAPGSLVSVSFTAHLASGTSSISLSDVGVTNETAYVPITVTNGTVTLREFTLGVTLDGSGSVTKNPNQATYPYGTVVQLTATANTGWTFGSWSGNLSGSTNPASITMNGNKSVTAHFTQNQYTLTITIDGSGSVTKNPDSATYTYGTVVTLTAVASTGWMFSSWTGDLTGSQNPKTITMNGNKAVTAHFTQNQYTLTVTIDGSGSVTKNPNQATYAYGTVVQLTAVADSGWIFSSWTGDLTGSTNPASITMNGNKSVTAHFTQNQYTLTITIDGSGSVTKNPNQATYPYGQVVTLTAVPGTGWAFSSWTGDLTGSQNPKTITMNGNKAVTAHFLDAAPPQISGVARATSNPLDTDPLYGWVNVSCTVTDNVAVSQVILRIHNPSGSWNNVSMVTRTAGKYYYRTTTAFSTAGNYSYSIWAKDTSNNANTSSNVVFSMPPNWDVNSDGTCAIFDLVLISNHYGENGAHGWIREDADNNGEIQVLDLVYVSNHYGESWW